MSGGGGGVIIIKHARTALSDPIVHGSLPTAMQLIVDRVLQKHDDQWDQYDKLDIGLVYLWALCNLK